MVVLVPEVHDTEDLGGLGVLDHHHVALGVVGLDGHAEVVARLMFVSHLKRSPEALRFLRLSKRRGNQDLFFNRTYVRYTFTHQPGVILLLSLSPETPKDGTGSLSYYLSPPISLVERVIVQTTHPYVGTQSVFDQW